MSLADEAAARGVATEYLDWRGEPRRVPEDTVRAVLDAMGPYDDTPPPLKVVREGSPEAEGKPVGEYERLLVAPRRCPTPPRTWGWMAQLYAARSRASWGIGDLGDLRSLAAWSASVGAGFVVVSPLGAPNPGPEPEPSPYYPSTRRFGNPLHLRVEDDPSVADLAAAGRSLNAEPIVDRARVLRLKVDALERAWAAGRWDRTSFDAWRIERGDELERWATFSVLTERHGPGWRSWPEPFREPASAAVAAIARDAGDRIGFHAWMQWCFDLQLEGASEPVRRIADMPVGVDPGGFDAWDWQEQLADSATIGAPPDRFNRAGQDWGLPPFIPHRLRAAGYRPFIETIRAQLRHAGGLRIDHVLGLFRLWWVPAGSDPSRGAYVRCPTDELLEIVAIESHRAGAIVIGEDLGTVPPGVRRELRRRNLLSTRLALFERLAPERYPRHSFAGVTTHDLPTVMGALSGADLDDQAAAGVPPDVAGLALLRERLVKVAGMSPPGSNDDLVVALHRRLADGPPMLVAATLEDALRVETRPNIPGTVAEQRANWSLALPRPIDELPEDPGVLELVTALRRPPRRAIRA